MSDDFNFSTSQNPVEFVDIHGRDLKTVISDTGDILIPLNEIKHTGFSIYKKSQYNKLIVSDSQFNDEFNLYMLDAAKNYMLTNRYSFKPEDVLKSIENCKKILTSKSVPSSPSANIILNNRLVQEKADHDFTITTEPTNVAPKLTIKNIREHNNHYSAASSSSTSSSDKVSPNISNRNPSIKQINQRNSDNSFSSDNTQFPKLHNGTSQPEKLPNQVNKPKISPIKAPDQNHPTREQKQNRDQTSVKRLPIVKLSEVHQVTVTHHEKDKIIWVREKKDNALFEKIYNELKQIGPKQSIVNGRYQYNRFYIAEDQNQWYRCKVVRFNPLTVCFVDYGNTVEAENVKHITRELAQYPCLANRISFRESYKPVVGGDIEIKVNNHYDDGTYGVEVLLNNNKLLPRAKTEKPVVEKPSPIYPQIVAGERVTIIDEVNNKLYLRTYKGYINLEKIKTTIKETNLQRVESVNVGDFVLCQRRNESNEFEYCRGVVKSQNSEDLAEVDFLDYEGSCISSIDALRQSPEELNSIEVTYIILDSLAGFKGKQFTSEMRKSIKSKIQFRKKYTIISVGREFDLSDTMGRLSDQLQMSNSNGQTNVLMLNDIEVYKPKLGISGYMCTHFKSLDNIVFVPNDALEANISNVFFNDVDDQNTYHPIEGEVCIGAYNDSWNRCVVTRVLSGQFEIMFIDFGNVELRNASQLRKAGPECKLAPALAIPCRLVDLPQSQKAEKILRKYIVENEVYNVEVKKFNDGKYDITIPSTYEILEKM